MSLPVNKIQSLKALQVIPGVGKSIATDLWNIGIRNVPDLQNQDPEELYRRSNAFTGVQQDRCLLYVFRSAVYYASTEPELREAEKLKWWRWKDAPVPGPPSVKRSRRSA